MKFLAIALFRRCFLGLLLLTITIESGQTANPPADSVRIGLLTMGPGRQFFERFGHDALIVLDRANGQAISYNFGYFDPSEPDFIPRFLRGQMQYALVALPLKDDLDQYEREGRSARLQWLRLTPAEADRLAFDLATLSRPEFARYHYDYLTANCATKVRDALDRALNGAIAPQLTGLSHGQTYRKRILALAAADPWMEVLLDIGLGPSADQPLTQWQETFIPMQFAHHLGQVHTADGHALVQQTTRLFEQQIVLPAARTHSMWWWLIGVISAATLLGLARRPRLSAVIAAVVWLICSLAGWLLLGLWLFTAHRATWMNANLLLLNPLCLLAMVDIGRVWKGQAPTAMILTVHWLIACTCLAALALHGIQTYPQDNMVWITLIAPLHCVQAFLRQNARNRAARSTNPISDTTAITSSPP